MVAVALIVGIALQGAATTARCIGIDVVNFVVLRSYADSRQFTCAQAWIERAARDVTRQADVIVGRALLALERQDWQTVLQIQVPERPPGRRAAVLFARGYAAARYAGRGERPAFVDEARRAAAALTHHAEPDGRQHVEVARALVLASAAAAQDERDEMRIYLAHAAGLLDRLLPDTSPPVLLLDPLRLSGDLWLHVDRDEEALQSYRAALRRDASCAGCMLGIARAAARLNRTNEAVAAAKDLLARWAVADQSLPEVEEVRTIAGGPPRQ